MKTALIIVVLSSCVTPTEPDTARAPAARPTAAMVVIQGPSSSPHRQPTPNGGALNNLPICYLGGPLPCIWATPYPTPTRKP